MATSEKPRAESATPSLASSLTVPGGAESSMPPLPGHGEHPGHGPSAIPEDKNEEAFENTLEDWEDDPENARNWPARKKWLMVSIVRSLQYDRVQPTYNRLIIP